MEANPRKCLAHNKKIKFKCCQCEKYICSRCTIDKHANHHCLLIKYELEVKKTEISKELALMGDFTKVNNKKMGELRTICLKYKASIQEKLRSLREETFNKAKKWILKIENSLYEKLSKFEGEFQGFISSETGQMLKIHNVESVLKRLNELVSDCLEKKCDVSKYIELTKSIEFQNVENLIKFANGNFFENQKKKLEEEVKEIDNFLKDSKRPIDTEICNEAKIEYENIKKMASELNAQKTALKEEIRNLSEQKVELVSEVSKIKENKLSLQNEQAKLCNELKEKEAISEGLKKEIKKLQNINNKPSKPMEMNKEELKVPQIKIEEEKKLQSEAESENSKNSCIFKENLIMNISGFSMYM